MTELSRNPVECISVGLDMSLSATGFCLKRGCSISIETIKTTPRTCPNDLARLRYIVDKVMERIPSDVHMICIEDVFTPQMRGQTGAAIELAKLAGIIRLALYEAGYPFYVVSPSQIKKYVTGKGTAQKSIIIREVYKRWGIDAKDDNQADACAMAHVAECLVMRQFDDIPKFQVETIKKIIDERPKYNVEVSDGT